jgi:hypothetical protein
METAPPAAAKEFRQGGQAIVDESLLLQFHAEIGDPIKIGESQFTIAGALKKMPGEASSAGTFAPRVYIPLQNLAETPLLKTGSIARYRAYVKFPENTDVEARIVMLGPQIQRLGTERHGRERKRDLGTSLENLYRFLNLVGFISLLLGAVGVASAIQAHLQQKTKTGAILRCLGLSAAGTVAIYLVQTAAMGLFGAGFGALLGVALQQIFPRLLMSFLPLTISTSIAWGPIVAGVFIGFFICILFALPPLLKFRRLSPLRVFRAAMEVESPFRKRDPIIWLVYLRSWPVLPAFDAQTDTVTRGLVFAAALFWPSAFSPGSRSSHCRHSKFFLHGWSFVLRCDRESHRPNGTLLDASLGLGVPAPGSLSSQVLLAQFTSVGTAGQPNIFFFDIQPDQKAGVAETVRASGMPVIQEAPIVTMRLAEVKGRKTNDILLDPQRKTPEWELAREYRTTYRETLTDTEKISAGQWIGRVDYHPGDTVPISVDGDIAKDLRHKDRRRAGLRRPRNHAEDEAGQHTNCRLKKVPDEFLQRAFGKRADLSCPGQPRPDSGRLGEIAERHRGQIPERFRDRSNVGDSNRRFNPEQSGACHPRDVSLHGGRRRDCAGEHDLERALPAAPGKHFAAHARGVSPPNLEDPLRRIFPARSFCQRYRDCSRSERRFGEVCFGLSRAPSAAVAQRAGAVSLFTVAVGLIARGGSAPPLEILRAEAE